MRVLILRPEAAAQAMVPALEAAGCRVEICPLLRIDGNEGVASAARAASPDVLVLTSVNAVGALRRDEALPDLFAIPVVAVGPATATAARSAGFVVVIEAAGDGDAVVALVKARFPAGTRVVHVAGRDRTGGVAERLATCGYPAEVVVAYQAEAMDELPPQTAAQLAGGDYDVAVIASARTAEAFRRSVEGAGLALPLARPAVAAISVQAAAPLAGVVRTVGIADRPDGAALTKGVIELARRVADNGGIGPG